MSDTPTPSARPPEETHPRRERLIGFAFSIVVLYCTAGLLYQPLIQMFDEVRLHRGGLVAVKSSCQLSEWQTLRGGSWSLHVDYVAQDGTRHSPNVDSELWVRRPDQSQPCIVSYDPDSPEHAGTNWGYSRLVGRAMTYAAFVPPALFLALMVIRFLWRMCFPGGARSARQGDRTRAIR